MKLKNQDAGHASRAIKGVVKAGCENPATSAHVDVGIAHKHTMPMAAMAGSFSRKIPGPAKVGQDVAGKSGSVSGKFVVGKKLTKSMGGKPTPRGM